MNQTVKTVLTVSAIRLGLLFIGAVSMFLAFKYDLSHADMTYAMQMITRTSLGAFALGAIVIALLPKAKTIKYFFGL